MALQPEQVLPPPDTDTTNTAPAIDKGVVVTFPRVHEKPTPKRGLTRRRFLAGLAGLAAGVLAYQTEPVQQIAKAIRAEGERMSYLTNRSLDPQSEEEVDWWKELSEEEIQGLAQIPQLRPIGERYISTVSPTVQEKAQKAGYKLIYQGDPEDTVGRSVVAADRELDKTAEDLGFGQNQTRVHGIFKSWVPNPKDPEQKERVYALFTDPITGAEWTTSLLLFAPHPNDFENQPTRFGVNNLDYGPHYIKENGRMTGGFRIFIQENEDGTITRIRDDAPYESYLPSEAVPDPDDPPEKRPGGEKWKEVYKEKSPTFFELVRLKGVNLPDLIRPGDYVVVGLYPKGFDERRKEYSFHKDELGVLRAGIVYIRRFGGMKQWQSEVQETHAQDK